MPTIVKPVVKRYYPRLSEVERHKYTAAQRLRLHTCAKRVGQVPVPGVDPEIRGTVKIDAGCYELAARTV